MACMSRKQRTDFRIFSSSETPSRIRRRPLGVVPRRGARGADLVTFAIRA